MHVSMRARTHTPLLHHCTHTNSFFITAHTHTPLVYYTNPFITAYTHSPCLSSHTHTFSTTAHTHTITAYTHSPCLLHTHIHPFITAHTHSPCLSSHTHTHALSLPLPLSVTAMPSGSCLFLLAGADEGPLSHCGHKLSLPEHGQWPCLLCWCHRHVNRPCGPDEAAMGQSCSPSA